VVLTATDYSPFGVGLYGRSWSEGYRYGFQGQEKDDEIKGEGNSVNYKYRMHDPRLGMFFAVDPLSGKYPHNSSYAFSENRVIASVEIEGLEAQDLNGNIVFVKDPRAHVQKYSASYSQNNSEGGYTKTEIEINYQTGYIYSNKGNRVKADLTLSGTTTKSTYDSKGKLINKTTKNTIERTHKDIVADCHGKTFVNDEMWIDNYAVSDGSATVDVLLKDGYTEVPNKRGSDIVVFYKGGKVVHSAVTTAAGYDANAGETVTRSHSTLAGASGGLTDIAKPGNVKHYKNNGNKVLILRGGAKAGTTTGVKIYDKSAVDTAFKKSP